MAVVRKEYKVGDRINHEVYGPGVVVDIQEREQYIGKIVAKDSPLVYVKFDSGIEREYFQSYKNKWGGESHKVCHTPVFEFTDWSLTEHCVDDSVMEDPEDK